VTAPAPPQVADLPTTVDPGPPGSLLSFFLLAFAFMWTCFITVTVTTTAQTGWGQALLILGAYAPGLAAIAVTGRAAGRAGVAELLRRVTRTPVAARWFVFAAVYIAAIKLAVALVHRLIAGEWPRFGTESLFLIPVAIAFSTPFQAGEEIGWRGFALPRLAARMGWAWASIVLGLIWAVWHLPQFFVRGGDSHGQSFWVFVLQVTAISVAMVWLYLRVGGSLLPLMLFHSAINNSKDIVPSATAGATDVFGLAASRVAWLTVALLWLCAVFFLARLAPRTRSSSVA